MIKTRLLSVFVLLSVFTSKAQFGGGDSGDMAGALTGLFAGGGGGGGGDDDGDDDPNMVGGKHKKHKGKKGDASKEIGGLEKSLQTGGVDGLVGMLNAMRAAQGSSDTHIIKDKNGEDMYDFRDLDDDKDATTMKPITVEPFIMTTASPAMFEVPSAPRVALPGKHGKWQAPKAEPKPAGPAKEATVHSQSSAKLVVWGDKPSQPAPQPTQPVVPQAVGQPLPVGQPTLTMNSPPVGAPMIAPATPWYAQQAPATPWYAQQAPPPPPWYQGLSLLRQNMDTLMNEVATLANGQANTGSVTAKVDDMSKHFMADEQKMDKRLDDQANEIKTLEQENGAMRKQLDDQTHEMKTMEQESEEKSKAKHEVAKEATKIMKEVSDADETMAQATGVEMKRAEKVVAQVNQGQQQLRGQTQKVPSIKVQKVVSSAKKSATLVSTSKAPAHVVETWDATFSVNLDGKAGGKDESFTVRVHPEWAPQGAKRFKEIVQAGILKDSRFFRVVPGFMVQFGIPGTPQVAATWAKKHIPDEEVKQTNALGTMTFAKAGPNSRTTQIFINFANNRFLDKQGFAPFAEVLGDGMKVVGRIQAKYKERPNQGKIQHRGNTYLMKSFPDLSFIDHVDSPVLQSSSFIQHTQDQAGAQKQTTNDVDVASESDREVQHAKKKASQVQQAQQQVNNHQQTYLDDVDEDDSSSNDQSDGGDDDDGNWR